MNMGTTQRLRAARFTENGFYFTDGEAEVLLPRSEVPPEWRPGVEADLFLYRDSEDRPTATRRKPAAEVGQTALLEIVSVGPIGAFAHWGLLKDLLIPLGEQATPLVVGQSVLVMVLLDESTDRLYGSTRIAGYLSKDVSGFQLGQEVSVRVWKLHDQGWSVLVERQWQGLVYRNEAHQVLRPGEELKGYVYQLRDDGKIDVRLRPQGFQNANPEAEQRVLAALARAGGRLGLSDKSDPAEIQSILGLSKKAFKTACGTLLKRGLIELEAGAIISAKSAGPSD